MSNYINRDDLLIHILQMPSEMFPSEVIIIHCKDCRYHECGTQCKRHGGIWLDDDHCSKAERKEKCM